jgi:hypothetical protein
LIGKVSYAIRRKEAASDMYDRREGCVRAYSRRAEQQDATRQKAPEQ